MIIKNFQGKTEDEAVALAKKELGNGVVIMNVRNARKKGLLSVFRKSMVEVTVALEEEQEKPQLKPRPIPKPQPVRPMQNVYAPQSPYPPKESTAPGNPNILIEPEKNKAEAVNTLEERFSGKDRLLEEKLDHQLRVLFRLNEYQAALESPC